MDVGEQIRSSGKATRVLNHRIISPALIFILNLVYMCVCVCFPGAVVADGCKGSCFDLLVSS